MKKKTRRRTNIRHTKPIRRRQHSAPKKFETRRGQAALFKQKRLFKAKKAYAPGPYGSHAAPADTAQFVQRGPGSNPPARWFHQIRPKSTRRRRRHRRRLPRPIRRRTHHRTHRRRRSPPKSIFKRIATAILALPSKWPVRERFGGYKSRRRRRTRRKK